VNKSQESYIKGQIDRARARLDLPEVNQHDVEKVRTYLKEALGELPED
jgi:hypothetical protein